jgi:peptidoglycan/xylan/chitin deacetylase (PgdA/CDA1 family)
MRVAILTGADTESTRLSIANIASQPGVELAGIFLDTARPPFRRRVRNLRWNVRREGPGYVATKLIESVAQALDRLSDRIVPLAEVDDLLRRAFPHESFSLQELADRLRIPLVDAGNLNSPGAAASLAAAKADLGVVIGTRILKRSTFGVPRLGCINLHKGKVPEYRGLPPGFWELYEEADTAGVTVHFIDEGLDTGDIVATESVTIHPRETPVSLAGKLDAVGASLIAAAVADIAAGTAVRRPQPPHQGRARMMPTRAQRQALARRADHLAAAQESASHRIVKNLAYLLLYYSGAVPLLRRLRRASRGCIVLYHRVNDTSVDSLTASRRRFAEHLVLLRRHYRVRPSSWIADQVRAGGFLRPTTVAIHFDDTYEDVCEFAAPLLEAAGLPAASFISTGFLDTARPFAHDEAESPHQFRNMTSEQVRDLPHRGIEVCAHTVNHVDMGRVVAADGVKELREAKAVLEKLIGGPILAFSFPFGRPDNFRPDVAQWTRDAGYRAVFSASGGFITRKTTPWNIPRIGGYEANRALYLLFEIEGLALARLRARFR